MLKRETIKNNTKIIDTLIGNHVSSPLYQSMLESDEYYYMRNTDIMNRKNMVSVSGTRKGRDENGMVTMVDYTEVREDTTKANNKIPHGFHYELTNQCKNFLAGRPVRLSWKHFKPTKEFKQELDVILTDDNDWGSFVQSMIKDAQKYSKSFARVSVDKRGRFRFTPVSPKEVIPIKDEFGDIYIALRMYTQSEWNEDGEEELVEYVEVLDDVAKDTYRKDKEWELVIGDEALLAETISHGDNVSSEERLSWGRVPIIEWKFTDDDMNALNPIKHFIDLADSNISDFANDLDDINELVWILKNYDGQDLGQFMSDMKENKTIKVGADGDVRTERNELPYKARVELYNLIIVNIYRFGRGIDFTDRENLGNITGTGLKWSYELLEEKANELELHGQKALDDLFDFIYLYMRNKGTLKEDLNATNLEFIFDRSLMINEAENIETAMKFATYGSLETALEHVDWVHDVDEELERINASGDMVTVEDLLDGQFERDNESEDDSEDTEEVSEEDKVSPQERTK